MAEQFYTILTTIGKAKIANSSALGTNLNLTQFAVGDSNGKYYNPTEQQTTLINEVWRGNIGSISVDADNPNWIIIEVIIPSVNGGFMIREGGVFDIEGDLIAIAKYPETYKPLSTDGSTKDLVIRMILEVSNTANVTLKVDPTVIIATKKDILDIKGYISNHESKAASITQSGHVKLNNTLTSESTTEALTAAQGKILDDKIESQKSDIVSLNKIKKNITISTTGWTLDSATNLYKYKIEDADITADTIVDVNIKVTDLEKASDFKSANESFLGYVEIYSESIPTSNILCDLKLTKQVVI